MTKRHIWKCPVCGGFFKNSTSHLLRSKHCGIARKPSPTLKIASSKKIKTIFNMPLVLNDKVQKILYVSQHPIPERFNIHIPMGRRTSQSLEKFDDSPIIDTNVCNDIPTMNNHYNLDVESSQGLGIHSFLGNNLCDNLIAQSRELNKNYKAIIDKQTICLSQLVKLLNDTNAPLSLYKKIMDWAAHCTTNGFKFSQQFPSRSTIIKEISSITCLDGVAPHNQKILLSHNQTTVVNYFDFEQQCFSLLTDKELMIDDHFSFPNNNPCDYERKDKNCLSCIEDGDIFQKTASSVRELPNDFTLGLKLFIDATHTDVHSNWILDPVMFTFTFFNNMVCRKSSSWRTLGFINDTNLKSQAQNAQIPTCDKVQDFHDQLKVILNSLKVCQEKGGFMWNLKYKDVVHRVRMRPVVILIVGDAQGNHKITGMYGKFFDTGRVNHSCNCPWWMTDQPNVQCEFVPQTLIDDYCDRSDISNLQKLSHHNISNAFRTIQLGNHHAGLNAIMPSEILHQLFLGILEYIIYEFFNEFTPKGKSHLDEIGSLLYYHGKHQSDRSLPSFGSRNGFTNMTKQRGSDKIGTCLLCLLCLSMNCRHCLVNKKSTGPSPNRMSKYRNLFEKLLLFSQWLCSETFDRRYLPKAEDRITSIMIDIKRLVKRSSNNGWRLSKFHEMKHTVRDIYLFGPPDGYDGRPGESAHKQTKMSARKTQRRKDEFEYQTCSRIYETTVINGFHGYLRYNEPKLFKSYHSHDCYPKEDLNSSYSHYYISVNEDNDVVSTAIDSSNICSNSTTTEHMDVINFIYDKMKPLSLRKIPCRYLLKTKVGTDGNTHLFRSHPSFKKGESWYDWAWFRWLQDDSTVVDVPARIYSFVDLRNISFEEADNFKDGYTSTIYACVRSLQNYPRELYRGSKILYTSKFELTEERYRLVDIESLNDFCYVIPNLATFDFQTHYDEWIIVANRYTWGDYFLDD